jgi:8-oxo-dGTP pyrophosphatase MutT (NUDIX family)
MDFPESERIRWKVLDHRPLYQSPWINLWQATVRLPDGSVIPDYHIVDYPRPAVGVVPIGADGRVLLVDQDRFIGGERGWEIPGGGVDAGEEPAVAARREAWEEGGAECGALIRLGSYRPSIGNSSQLFLLYAGQDTRQRQAIHDTNEVVGVRWFTPAEVRALIEGDAIRDGLSLTALLLAFFHGYL